ncbi:MAG: phosphotransferase [Chloroflexota bacterium]
MYLPIENPTDLIVTRPVHQVLSRLFTGYRHLVLQRELNKGFSGGRVIQVRPVNTLGLPELPLVVKVAAISQIQKEWHAYGAHVKNRLPGVPDIPRPPAYLPQAGLGGICYNLVGYGIFELTNLADYLRSDGVQAMDMHRTVEHIRRMMHFIWDWSQEQSAFRPDSSYDRLLPVHLLVHHDTTVAAKAPRLVTPHMRPDPPIEPGEFVRLRSFAVHKANWATHTITLKRPYVRFNESDYFVRCRSLHDERIAGYHVDEIGPEICGVVTETRESRLRSEVINAFADEIDPTLDTFALPDPYLGYRLPNPLSVYEQVLSTTRPVRVAPIHGDLNLDNVLIEKETGKVHLIDFAETRHDHVLHDLLRLEAEAITKLLSKLIADRHLNPISTLLSLYRLLHEELLGEHDDEHPPASANLSSIWIMLSFVRRTARTYLFDPTDVSEYYQGLFIYMLGYMKFKNLNTMAEAPLPKQLAFWGAAIAYVYMTGQFEQYLYHITESNGEVVQ